MAQKLIRGRILSFHAEPQTPDDQSAHSYIEDGALLIENGLIIARGNYAEIRTGAEEHAEEIDHRPNLLVPGFIDPHLHFPQVQVIASWGAQLLDWLNTYTFPEEARYSDQVHATRMASHFFDELIRHGTTTASAFCSVHRQSAEAFFQEAERRNMRMIGGKVMMDRNAPTAVCDTPQSGYDDTKTLIKAWHQKGRASYAITPRFAITSSPEQLEACKALAEEHPDCFIQTHINENHDEIKLTGELYPDARDYLDVYEQYNLLGPKTLLGHCIHMKEREIEKLVETGSRPVFCPTSNLFLGSGLFDYEGLRARGAHCAIATDIGGGTSYSMLQTLNEGYKVLAMRGQKLHPLRAFYWMTLGNAQVLGLEDKIGTLEVGTEADIIVLDARATPAMALRSERCQTLAEELFILQIMGDDRAINAVYIAGNSMKG